MKRILVTDDDSVVRMTLERGLSRAGYSILLAENGRAGLELAREQMPDLILLDIMMPEMGGGETITSLKKIQTTKDIPVIFITSLVEKDDIEEGFVTGSKSIGQYFISKPFDMEEVLRLVRLTIGEP